MCYKATSAVPKSLKWLLSNATRFGLLLLYFLIHLGNWLKYRQIFLVCGIPSWLLNNTVDCERMVYLPRSCDTGGVWLQCDWILRCLGLSVVIILPTSHHRLYRSPVVCNLSVICWCIQSAVMKQSYFSSVLCLCHSPYNAILARLLSFKRPLLSVDVSVCLSATSMLNVSEIKRFMGLCYVQ